MWEEEEEEEGEEGGRQWVVMLGLTPSSRLCPVRERDFDRETWSWRL